MSGACSIVLDLNLWLTPFLDVLGRKTRRTLGIALPAWSAGPGEPLHAKRGQLSAQFIVPMNRFQRLGTVEGRARRGAGLSASWFSPPYVLD